MFLTNYDTKYIISIFIGVQICYFVDDISLNLIAFYYVTMRIIVYENGNDNNLGKNQVMCRSITIFQFSDILSYMNIIFVIYIINDTT